jgi:WD40 repeat protein
VKSFESEARLATVALADDGRRIAWAALDGGVVSLVDVDSGELVKELKPAGTLGVAHVGFAPGGRTLVTSGPRGVDLWDAATGARAGRLRVDPQHTTFVFSPAGDRIVTKRNGVEAELWDMASGARLAGFSGHDAEVTAIAFSSDGRMLVTGSHDRTARVYDTASTPLEHFWNVDDMSILSWDSTTDGSRVAVVDRSNGIHVMATRGEGLTPPIGASLRRAEKAWFVAFSPDGARFAAGFAASSLDLCDSGSGAVQKTLALDAELTAVAWSAQGRIAAGTKSGAVLLFAADGTPERSVPGQTPIRSLTFSADGEHLVVSHQNRNLRILKANGDVAAEPGSTIGFAADVAFSADGASMAVAEQERVRWFDTRTWQAVELRDHEQGVIAVAFSPDGTLIASGSADQTVVVRTRGGPPKKLTGHGGAVTDVAFSPDGKRLVSASEDGSARVWDLSLGAALEVSDPFGGAVDGVRFVGDDRLLLYGRGVNGGSVALLKSPPPDRGASVLSTGAVTNLRVCRSNYAVVPIVPPPAAESVWAPDELCVERP